MATTILGQYERVRAFAATARVLVTAGVRAAGDTDVVLFDHAAGKITGYFEMAAQGLAAALCGPQVAVGCSDGAVRLVALNAGEKATPRVIAAHAGAVTGVACAPDGDRLASVGVDGALRLWSVASGARTAEWQLGAQPLRAVAIDPSGEYVAAAGDDGVVRVVTLATGARREMPGHDGAVFALVFTPRDGRLASAGDDGKIRLWYVVGDVECEARGGDESGHAGAIHALLFPPTPEGAPGQEPADRLYSAGADGKIKIWPLESRRKPRTLDAGSKPLFALAFAPPHSPSAARSSLGSVFAGGDRRSVLRFALDLQGAASDSPTSYGHAYDVLAQNLTGQRPIRENTVQTLAGLDDPEAHELLLQALKSDRDEEVRTLAATELGQRGRRWARAALRERLDDDRAGVRAAALTALRAIDGASALGPLRAALGSSHADIRVTALAALPPLRESSPLVPGTIAEHFTDRDAAVRAAALESYGRLFPAGSPEPLRAAFERGPADLQVDVLVRAAVAGMTREPSIAPLVARGLDAADPAVRRTAFAVLVLSRRALAAVLEARDEDLSRAIREVARRAAQLAMTAGNSAGKGPSDEQVAAARTALPGTGSAGEKPGEDDLAPLLTALSCHTPDTALRGARGLAQLGDTRALGALLQLSREGDPALRRQAALALQQLDDPRAQKRLLWMLDDEAAVVRGAALDAYAALAHADVLAVADAALRSAHEDLRVRGLDQLVKLGEKSRAGRAEALLGDALEDEGAKVRSEAFRTLWSWHDKDPAKALDRALAARFPDLRLRAVSELQANGAHDWARARLLAAVSDRDSDVAQAAYDARRKLVGKDDLDAHLAALVSAHPSVRASAARESAHAPVEKVRPALTRMLQDEHPAARTAALETLDKLLPNEAGAHYAALQGGFAELKVRAAELLAVRHDEQLIEPMRTLLADKELARVIPPEQLRVLRARAASALATLGAPRTVKYFATELLKDEDPQVREQAARGMSVACRRGDEGFLLDALGHADIWVRSWAADGLARLGDARAVPVLTGTLRHEHLPIRLSAVLSFAALGPEGFGGMLQGLEDPLAEVQERIFAIILARDLRAFRQGNPPDLLTSALSSQRPEVRFAAARALELRVDPEEYLAHVIEVLMPPRPEKVGDMKDWPGEEPRGRILAGLADSLASDVPEQRYAAANVLNLRRKPLEYFREAQRVARLRAAGQPYVPDTTPRSAAETDTKPKKGWLRRLFSGDGAEGGAKSEASRAAVPDGEQQALKRLAFGAYVGLLRQVATGDDEATRVRRDAVDRIVELGLGPLGVGAALPAVQRALDDPHYLVRKAAFAGLKKLLASDPGAALSLALTATAADIARAALDELTAQGASARPRIVAALNSPQGEVRQYAFELLEKLSPRGSLEPLLAALASEHASLRIGVIERLARSHDARVTAALSKALESDHDDLRLRAAELLAQRRDDRTVDVLASFLRADDAAQVDRAREALAQLGTAAAVRTLAARFDDVPAGERLKLIAALARIRTPEAVDALAARLDDETAQVRAAAFDGALAIAGEKHDERNRHGTRDKRDKRDHALALRLLRAAVRSKDPEVRQRAASQLDAGDDPTANDLLAALFADREAPVRIAAVTSYGVRVREKSAPVAPLEAVLREGRRELVLPSAEGVAARGNALALRPLLLVVRAGEPDERSRAALALGALGDARALAELETLAAGGTPEAPVELPLQSAATEGLGRIAPRLTDAEAHKRVVERVEQAAMDAAEWTVRAAAVRGLRWIGGERARGRIEALLADEAVPPGVRTEAAEQLGLLGDVAAEGALARALDDDHGDTRATARAALDKLLPSERTRVEFLAVDSTYPDVSQPAAEFLANEGDPRLLVPRLATLRDPALRERLRYGLVRRGAAPVAELSALLVSEAPAAREEAAWLVGARGEGGLTESDKSALGAALAQGEQRGATAWPAARNEEREAITRAWQRALWAATALGRAEVLPRARAIVQGGEAKSPAVVRREAVHLVGKLGGAADAAVFEGALADVDAAVRGAAASALASVAPERAAIAAERVRPFDAVSFGPAAVQPAARASVLKTEEGRRLALPAAIAARDAAPLVALARDKAAEPAARLDALAALGRAGGPDALAALRAMAFDKKDVDELTRKAAYRALRRAGRAAARARKYEATNP